jgi:hypothetical protein
MPLKKNEQHELQEEKQAKIQQQKQLALFDEMYWSGSRVLEGIILTF